MKNLLIIAVSIILLTSCGSTAKPQEEATDIEESAQCNPTYPSSSPSAYDNSTNDSGIQSNIQQTESNASNVSDGDGYQFGYNMGVIAGQNNDPYNPYLPNTSSYPMAYRQAYCRGYDAGYQDGQTSAGRPSYYVNTGEEDVYDDGGDVYYYEDDDY